MAKHLVKLAFAVCAASFSSPVWALANYVPYIPNGDQQQCLNCHMRVEGGDARNPFGVDVLATRTTTGMLAFLPNWPALYNLDSDGDGFTNGEELGDPCGVWRRPMTPPITMGITRPGDDTSVPAMHTVDTCVTASSSSEASSGPAPSSSAAQSSSTTNSSSVGTTTGGGGCCGGGSSAARAADVSLLALFVLVLRRRRR